MSNTNNSEQEQDRLAQEQRRLGKQDEDLPMDLGSLQDIFTFKFYEGRPVTNIIMAILWSIGLPILLYQLLKPRLGQVLAMIVASAPPLVIVISRMITTRKLDILGFVAGISFLITGIISIAQPSPAVSSICESIVPLLIGVLCLLSLLPIKFGNFELRPLIFQITNQLMPRVGSDEDITVEDEQRLQQQQSQQQQERTSSSKTDKSKVLNWVYTNMAKFRSDLRILTACWGIVLIIGFIVKAIIASTNTDISKAQNFGYYFFTLSTLGLIVFSWLFSKLMKKHVKQEADDIKNNREGYNNLQWGIQAMNTGFNQVVY